MIWDLQGNDQQNTLVIDALARCDFPWEQRLTKIPIPVRWEDLSRFRPEPEGVVELRHGHDHGEEFDTLEARHQVLGLAWYSGEVWVDLTLAGRPMLAYEVFLSEAAHMFDFFGMTDDERIAVWNAVHDPMFHLEPGTEVTPDGGVFHQAHSEHGWFDRGQYFDFVGEAFMGLFVRAFAPSVPVTIEFPEHPATERAATLVRVHILGTEPQPPDDTPPSGCLLGFMSRLVRWGRRATLTTPPTNRND